MTLRKWLGGGGKEIEEPEKRTAPRLVVHSGVKVSGGERPDETQAQTADLIDFSSGGLRLRLDAPLEVGETVWIQAKVAHASPQDEGCEAGVTWEAEKPVSPLEPSRTEEIGGVPAVRES